MMESALLLISDVFPERD